MSKKDYTKLFKPCEVETPEFREIEFRAWSKSEQEMYYDIIMMVKDTEEKCGYTVHTFGEIVPDAVLMQFTGLRDSTQWDELTDEKKLKYAKIEPCLSEWAGKKVFEGDIAEYELNNKKYYMAIKYDSKIAKFIYPEYPSEFKVVGNIFENADLLKKKN